MLTMFFSFSIPKKILNCGPPPEVVVIHRLYRASIQKQEKDNYPAITSFVVRIKQIFEKRCIGFMVFNATHYVIKFVSDM
jgi:hypothetical protein